MLGKLRKLRAFSLIEVVIAVGFFGAFVVAWSSVQRSHYNVVEKSGELRDLLDLREVVRAQFSCAQTTAASDFECGTTTYKSTPTRRANDSVLTAVGGTGILDYSLSAQCKNGDFDFVLTNKKTNEKRSLFNDIPVVCSIPPPVPATLDIPVRPVCSNNIALGGGIRSGRYTQNPQWVRSYNTTQSAASGLGIKLYPYNSNTPVFTIDNPTASTTIVKAVTQDFLLPGSLFASAPDGEFKMAICHRNLMGACTFPDCGPVVEAGITQGMSIHGYGSIWTPANSWWRPSAGEQAAIARKEICVPKGGIEDVWINWVRLSDNYQVSGYSENVTIVGGRVIKARNIITYHSYSYAHKLNNKFAIDEQDISRGNYNCTIEATPLIIDLRPIEERKHLAKANWVNFDLNGDGVPEHTTWPWRNEQALLALDRDGSGCIENGSELFGEYSDGKLYPDGFSALAEYDFNHDGVIDSSDAVFTNLKLWRDDGKNGSPDGICEPTELIPLTAMGFQSLSLESWSSRARFDSNGTTIKKIARAYSESGVHPLLDVYFKVLPVGPLADQE